jgi:hypothetical protein
MSLVSARQTISGIFPLSFQMNSDKQADWTSLKDRYFKHFKTGYTSLS